MMTVKIQLLCYENNFNRGLDLIKNIYVTVELYCVTY